MKNICYNNILHIRSAGKCIEVGIFWAWEYFDWIIKQLLDEAEYDMSNYADRSINTMTGWSNKECPHTGQVSLQGIKHKIDYF